MPAAAETDELAARLGGLFDADIAVACLPISTAAGPLFKEEKAAMVRARAARRREFTAGRMAARNAMAALGLPPRSIPMHPDRAPVWPNGVIGSISHTDTCAAAAVARATTLRAIGLDLEPVRNLPDDLWHSVLDPSERTWLGTQRDGDQGHLATLIFSAKECAYKAQYPLTKHLFDFHTLSVALDVDLNRFTAVFQRKIGAFSKGDSLTGRFFMRSGMLATGVTIPLK